VVTGADLTATYDSNVAARRLAQGSDRNIELETELRAQARQYARLTPAEEQALLGQRDGDGADSLVQHNLDLVVKQAESHAGRGLSFADLYQEGTLGLVDAVRAYDGQGDFREFASLHIGLQMDSLIEVEAHARREEEALLADCRALDLVEIELRHRLGREATADELGAGLDWPAERVARVRVALDEARAENDVATLPFLDDAILTDLADELERDGDDGRRKMPGAGPDD
jgi:DNA-directed RNA polymerase sigma subunit (sigma70/sigma32)